MKIKFEKMKRLKVLNLFLLVLLGLAAGSAKLLKTPEELQFFQQFGFPEIVLVMFGAIQILGGVLTIFNQARLLGIVILVVTFLSSTTMILFAGQYAFAIFSLLPLMMLYFACKYPLASTEITNSEETAASESATSSESSASSEQKQA